MLDFEIFTDKIAESGRRLIRQSYDEARSRDHNQLTAEHVLFAFAKTNPSFFNQVMQNLNLDRQTVLPVLDKQLNQYDRHIGRAIKASVSFMNLLADAHKQAHENNRSVMESIDIFAAIFKNKEGFCSKLFRQSGIDGEKVIEEIQKQTGSNKPLASQPPSNQRGL